MCVGMHVYWFSTLLRVGLQLPQIETLCPNIY